MLKQLYIKNFTLIDILDIRFDSGFSVITGETGAGKSIILGAIGLLLGQRADSKSIKEGADRCIIEAHFDLSKYHLEPLFAENDIDYDADDCIIRREITSAGKSRAFVNDTPASLVLLKTLGERLVDIHSQHQNLLLNKEDFQLSVVDIIAQDQETLAVYARTFQDYKKLCGRLDDLKQSIEKNRDNADFMRFQWDELEQARLLAGELEELETRSETMAHAEDIKNALYETVSCLEGEENGAVSTIRKASNALKRMLEVYPGATELYERLESSLIEIKDIAQEADGILEKIDFDPQEMERVDDRINTYYTLLKKHHVDTVDGLIQLRDSYGEQLMHLDNGDEEVAELERQKAEAEKLVLKKGEQLTKQRMKAAQNLEKEMRERLVPLGIPHVRFSVQCEQKAPSPNGCDKISFLFSANTSTAMMPIAQVASGGEIARVMLSLKAIISSAVKLPTIIFDEIDTGVSGKIAEQMAMIMKEMGDEGRQVISITHLPQIAAKGKHHYKVFKDETAKGTASSMILLSDEERIREIAAMLSGSLLTDAALNNARELLCFS